MLHRYSEVLNLPVICADNGRKAGSIKDILFDLDGREVKALLLEHTGLLPGKRVIFLDKLSNLGKDAAIIRSTDCVSVVKRKAFANLFGSGESFFDGDRGSLIGRRVYSKAGGELGIVKDVIFDISSGKIEAFEISDGVLQDIIQGRRLLPLFGKIELGEEFAIVDSEAVEEMDGTGGGIKNRLLQ